jgi:hypothetical protein
MVQGQQKILAPSMTMTMQQMTRSLSIAADILRKEPEQETFVRLDMTPIGMVQDLAFRVV